MTTLAEFKRGKCPVRKASGIMSVTSNTEILHVLSRRRERWHYEHYLEHGDWEVVGEDDPRDRLRAGRRGQRALVGVEPLRVQPRQDRRQRERVRQLRAGVEVLDGRQVLDDRCQQFGVVLHHLRDITL